MTAPERYPASHDHRRRWLRRMFAWGVAKSKRAMDRDYGERKRALFAALSGTVVEIGAGAGANLEYYPKDARLIAIEPNPYMHAHLLEEARRLNIAVDLRFGRGEELDLPDQSADAVVCTLVLCSVYDPAGFVAEAGRILKPGGRFLFIEHVAAPAGTLLRRMQSLVCPCWRFFGDGCHPNRETWRILHDAGFERLELEHFRVSSPFFVIAPHIAGAAYTSDHRGA